MSLPALLNLAAASGVVGTFLPVLLALINQEHWSSKVKGLITGGLSTVAGVITAWGGGSFTGANWLVSTVVVLLVASGSYAAFWKPTTLAPLIESLTTFSRSKLPHQPTSPAGPTGAAK